MSRPTFVTLGPAGTCHEHAMARYLDFQGLADADVELVGDFHEGLELVHDRPDTYLVQCSAHPDVHVLTERYRHEVYVMDTFMYPALEMALVVRAGVAEPRSLGVVAAARGYVDLAAFETVIDEPANPIVARHLLEGRYDAGVTIADLALPHPEELRIAERFGVVDTTWLVYGRRRRFSGEVIGHRVPWLFTGAPEPAAEEVAA